MDFLALLGPLLSLGSSILGPMIGDQTNVKQTDNSNTTTAGTQLDTTSQSHLDKITRDKLIYDTRSGLNNGSKGMNDILNQLTSLNSGSNSFNPTDYVNGIMKAATATAQQNQESQINNISSATGGNESTNSAATLLGNKVRNETASTLAGVQAQAGADAAGIVNQRASTVAGLSGALDSHTQMLLSSLLQDQTQQNSSSIATGSNITKSVTAGDKSQHDWQSFFKDFSKIFSSNFHMAAT